ncbi:MAG: hypothetical protein GC154_07325 [bacterium]|nr:hypothetical protein [bacterium]
MTNTCCKHCGAPSDAIICPSCFLRYDHRAYFDDEEEDAGGDLFSKAESLYMDGMENEELPAADDDTGYSFQSDSKIKASAEAMLSWFARMPKFS